MLPGDSNVATKCIQIGLPYVEDNAADRSNMPTVVRMLNSKTSLPRLLEALRSLLV
ncbi:hypothetical protein LINGRAHAP2_LOCUS36392 [Linum grandiflorum]